MQEPHYLPHHYYGGAVNGGPALPSSMKRTKQPQTPWVVPPNHVGIRMLCHVSRVGGLIGKSGSIIRQLQQETSAKIRVEDLPNSSGSNSSDVHRVILIIGTSSISRTITLRSSRTPLAEEEEQYVNHNNNGNVEELEVSAAQEAAVRVFERVLEVAAESDGVAGVALEGFVSCRLLVEKGQVGSLIGKGGKTIEALKRETGCKIKVLNKEKLPACAMPNDEMVELEGDISAVKKGLIGVSRCLQDCPLVNKTMMNGGRSFEESLYDPCMDLQMQWSSVAHPRLTSTNGFPSRGQSSFFEGDKAATMESRTSLREVVFNILCPNDRVGGVIGKGGSIVKNLQIETGAAISVGPSVPDCPERVVTVSSMENPESRYSPAQSAVILVFNRLIASSVEMFSSSKESAVSARLVVQAKEVGCLLGKGGAIISEMRKVTGAGLRILGTDQAPKCAIGNIEVVQITGALSSVQNALYNVTSRLRDNLLPFKMSNAVGSRSGSMVVYENGPHGGVRGPPPVGHHPSSGVSHDSDQHSELVHNMDQLRLGQTTDRPLSPKLWTGQTIPGANQVNSVDIGRRPTNTKSGSRSAIVTNTTMEIVVPDNVIDSIYGQNGSNLARLRQISGAKVIVHEPPGPGSTDRTIVISGSPEQTQAAQSLLQAFILQDHPSN